MRRSVLLVAAVLVVAVVVLAAVASRRESADTSPLRPSSLDASTRAAVDAFFERYVDPDGRVVRRDQGGDTVSEGQAYAMLLAVAIGDRARFDAAWGWARRHLQRPDGLLSWKWSGGRVADPSPAADADLDAARALVQAGDRFGAPELGDEGRRIATAVLDHETAEVAGGRVLVAGPWAVERRVVNPSYVSPCTYAELGAATGDDRWARLRDGDGALVRALLDGGRLPPDWAVLDVDGRPQPAAGPDEGSGAGGARYGPDAARLPFRLAEACSGDERSLARALWSRLDALDGDGAALFYALDGRRLADAEHPVGLVAAAAAARAAGDGAAARRLLTRAGELDQAHPTYYGAAWVALGHVFLEAPGA